MSYKLLPLSFLLGLLVAFALLSGCKGGWAPPQESDTCHEVKTLKENSSRSDVNDLFNRMREEFKDNKTATDALQKVSRETEFRKRIKGLQTVADSHCTGGGAMATLKWFPTSYWIILVGALLLLLLATKLKDK